MILINPKYVLGSIDKYIVEMVCVRFKKAGTGDTIEHVRKTANLVRLPSKTRNKATRQHVQRQRKNLPEQRRSVLEHVATTAVASHESKAGRHRIITK